MTLVLRDKCITALVQCHPANLKFFKGKIADEWTYAEFVDATFAFDTLNK